MPQGRLLLFALQVVFLVARMPAPGEQECSQHLQQDLLFATLSSAVTTLPREGRILALCWPLRCPHYLSGFCHLSLHPPLLQPCWWRVGVTRQQGCTVLSAQGHSEAAAGCEGPTGGGVREGGGSGAKTVQVAPGRILSSRGRRSG